LILNENLKARNSKNATASAFKTKRASKSACPFRFYENTDFEDYFCKVEKPVEISTGFFFIA